MIRLFLILSFLVLQSCIVKKDMATSESYELDVLQSQINSAPTMKINKLDIVSLFLDSMTVSFDRALDDHTASSHLEYRLVYNEKRSELTAFSDAIFDWKELPDNSFSFTLPSAQSLYFLLLVRDENGAISSYLPFSNGPILPADDGIFVETVDDHFVLSWNESTHGLIDSLFLMYRVYMSESDNISTIKDILENGTLVQDWTKGTTSYSFSEILSSGTYYFNVVVKTPFGYEVCYQAGKGSI